MTRIATLGAVLALFSAWPATSWAALADFRVNEVFPGLEGDSTIQFIELHVPPNTAGNCLFPTTRVEVFDSRGQLLGAVAPFSGTVCYEANTFFLLATPEAVAHFGVERDARLDVNIPREGGQVCLASSQTRYDCARWGAISEEDARRYLRNTDDATTAPAIPAGLALARAADDGVVATDFVFKAPTPRQPNDGTVILPPDAGPETPVDAPPVPDAAVPDARDLRRPDAPLPVRPDANFFDPAFLSADPGGGAACSCQTGGGPLPLGWILVAALAFLLLRRA